MEFINEQYETIFGQSVDTVRADPTAFLRRVHPEDVAEVEAAMQRANEGTPVAVVYRVGEEPVRWVESVAKPIDDESGEVCRIAGYTRDITEQMRREEELREQNERLERFAAIVSHDLRNPLSVATGYLGIARDVVDADGPVADHLATIGRALDRMERLIEDLLTLAREGQDVTEPTAVSLATVVRSSWANVDQGEATLVVETADATLLADEIRLAQVFENLFRNAIEHGGSAVTIRVGLLDDGAGLYVENDGEPIPESHRERIFESGFSTNRGGTGFGTAIVERIVRAHDWSISLADRTDGVRFEIRGIEFVDEA